MYLNIVEKEFCSYLTGKEHSVVVVWGTVIQAGSIPDEVIGFLNWPNPSTRTMALGSTLPLTETSSRDFLGGKRRPVGKGDNLTAICEPIF
jgi:hypothetical protein